MDRDRSIRFLASSSVSSRATPVSRLAFSISTSAFPSPRYGPFSPLMRLSSSSASRIVLVPLHPIPRLLVQAQIQQVQQWHRVVRQELRPQEERLTGILKVAPDQVQVTQGQPEHRPVAHRQPVQVASQYGTGLGRAAQHIQQARVHDPQLDPIGGRRPGGGFLEGGDCLVNLSRLHQGLGIVFPEQGLGRVSTDGRLQQIQSLAGLTVESHHLGLKNDRTRILRRRRNGSLDQFLNLRPRPPNDGQLELFVDQAPPKFHEQPGIVSYRLQSQLQLVLSLDRADRIHRPGQAETGLGQPGIQTDGLLKRVPGAALVTHLVVAVRQRQINLGRQVRRRMDRRLAKVRDRFGRPVLGQRVLGFQKVVARGCLIAAHQPTVLLGEFASLGQMVALEFDIGEPPRQVNVRPLAHQETSAPGLDRRVELLLLKVAKPEYHPHLRLSAILLREPQKMLASLRIIPILKRGLRGGNANQRGLRLQFNGLLNLRPRLVPKLARLGNLTAQGANLRGVHEELRPGQIRQSRPVLYQQIVHQARRLADFLPLVSIKSRQRQRTLHVLRLPGVDLFEQVDRLLKLRPIPQVHQTQLDRCGQPQGGNVRGPIREQLIGQHPRGLMPFEHLGQ